MKPLGQQIDEARGPQRSRLLVLTFALSLLGAATHLVPHDMGISTVGAVSMLAAAYLPRSLTLVPVLVTLLAYDLLNGFYGALGMSFVYLAHLAAALAVRPLLRRTRPGNLALASVANATVFYLVSNITPMALAFYPATLDGWIACYVAGLPFLLKGILANLAFGGAAFGAIWLVREYRANRLAAAERH